MKDKFIKFIKEDGMYLLVFVLLFILVSAINLVTFEKGGLFNLQIPFKTHFGTCSFIGTTLMAIGGFFLLWKIDKKKIKLEKVFLALVIPLGILWCLANPLGRVPDEEHHSRKAMSIANGNFFAKADETGVAYDMFNAKLNETVSKHIKSYDEAWKKMNAPETEGTQRLDYNTMALYAPICHMPQAIGIVVGKIIHAPIHIQCYLARVSNFLVAVFLIYNAIKLIPFKKHIIMFIAMLPITLYELASMSADALTISMSLFFISYVLYLKYDNNVQKISKKQLLILIGSSIVIALCKIVYIPLCLLLFILPKEKFESLKKKNIICISIIAICVILNLIWLVYCSRFLIEFNSGVNSKEQVIYILTHPITYILTMFRTMNMYHQTFVMSLCGEGLAHYSAQASVLFVLPCIALFAMVLLINEDKDVKIDWITKLISLAIFLIILLLIYTSLYVQWNTLKSSIITGIQSRYFIPILLLIPIIFNNSKIIINGKMENRYLLAFMLFFNLNALSATAFTYMTQNIIEYYVK